MQEKDPHKKRKIILTTSAAAALAVLSVPAINERVVDEGFALYHHLQPKHASKQELNAVRKAFDESGPIHIATESHALSQLKGPYSNNLPDHYPTVETQKATLDDPTSPYVTRIQETDFPQASSVTHCETYQIQVSRGEAVEVQAEAIHGEVTGYEKGTDTVIFCANKKATILTRVVRKS